MHFYILNIPVVTADLRPLTKKSAFFDVLLYPMMIIKSRRVA